MNTLKILESLAFRAAHIHITANDLLPADNSAIQLRLAKQQ